MYQFNANFGFCVAIRYSKMVSTFEFYIGIIENLKLAIFFTYAKKKTTP